MKATKTPGTKTPTTATCRRCKATLRSAKSVAKGIGPTCARLERKEAAVASFKPAQIAKAMELIELKAIEPIRGNRAFRVVASNGNGRYLTAPQACNCAAGCKSTKVDERVCYHRIAATYLAA